MSKTVLIILYCLLLLPESTFSQGSTLLGKWKTITTVNTPIARHENSFVHVKHKFYLLGGRGIKPVSIYNTRTNTWSKGAKPPLEIHHFQAVVYKGNIYVIGAMTGKYPYERPLANVLIYNPKKNIWTEGVEIPKDRRRGSAGVVIRKNKAYIVSGIIDGHSGRHVSWVDVYNFKTKQWRVLKDTPRPRDHFHAAIKKGKIYAAGGRNSSYATNQTFHLTIPQVDIYDIKTDSWTSLPQKNTVKIPRAGASSVILGDDLILIGGESMLQKNAHNQVDAFNIKTKKWRKFSPLNRGRHGSQAIVYKNSIYIAAGSGNRGGKPELNSMEKFIYLYN